MSGINRSLSQKAQVYVASVAEVLKTKTAVNANNYFLMGRTLLDKEAFLRLNDDGYEPVHGFSVIYGPFDTMASAHEFVAEYPEDMWPGHNDWTLIHPGQPIILTHHFDITNADVVHNKTHEFQGQVMVNEMARRKQEMADVKEVVEKVAGQEELTNEQLKELRDHYAKKLAMLDEQLK